MAQSLVVVVEVAGAVGGLSSGLVIGAFGLGCRHGLDVDHLSAITDLSCTQTKRARAMGLASLYIAGHALVVLAIGVVAIAVGTHLPEGVDEVMGRIVGLSLMVLAVITLVSIVRNRADFRPRSRWMFVLDGWRKVCGHESVGETVVVTHDHAHDHAGDHAHGHAGDHVDGADQGNAVRLVPASVAFDGDRGWPGATDDEVAHQPRPPLAHRHVHRHIGQLPSDPFPTYTSAGAFGLGALHGIGAETPSQILVLVAAAGAASVGAGLATLLAFVSGLVLSNTLVAVGAAWGFAGPRRHQWLLVATSTVVAVASFVVGAFFFLGNPPDFL